MPDLDRTAIAEAGRRTKDGYPVNLADLRRQWDDALRRQWAIDPSDEPTHFTGLLPC